MKFNFSTTLYLLLAIPLFFASCSKTGPTGPAGPAGPAGPTGAAGAAGTQGAQGNPGTANVIYSNWLDVAFAPITSTDSTGLLTDTLGFSADIVAPQLADSILNKGEVKVYLNLNNSDTATIVALPYTTLSGILINPYYSLGIISLVANANASTVTDTDGKKYLQYRYVLIPGGTAAGRNPKGNINWNNYAEVKQYLGLKD